jgi:hypothetical protein
VVVQRRDPATSPEVYKVEGDTGLEVFQGHLCDSPSPEFARAAGDALAFVDEARRP